MTWKRVATAVVLIPLVIGLVTSAPPILVALALALVILLAMFEFYALGDAIGHRAYKYWTATCAVLLVYVQWLQGLNQSEPLSGGLELHRQIGRFFGIDLGVGEVFFIFVIGIAALTLATRRPLVESLPAAGISSSALLLIAFPLSYAVRVHSYGRIGRYILLFALVITWVGDTAAYFVGRAIGKHPLAPKLSPKKTWEGTFASLAGAVLIAVAALHWLNFSPIELIGMAVAGNIAGQAGDLLESAYKRSAGVKDSGSLLPGHGGILDRIDALVLAIPVVWYYWIWFCLPRS